MKSAEILGNVGAADPAVLPALVGAMKDRDPDVRAQAALSLLKLGPAARDAEPALVEACQDRDARVREYAMKALAKVRGS
jgi:HEAT repeat protein